MTASDGKEIEVKGNTICFHGDNPRGPEIVQGVKGAREKRVLRLFLSTYILTDYGLRKDILHDLRMTTLSAFRRSVFDN